MFIVLQKYLSSNKVKLKISGLKSKLSRHVNKQENVSLNEEKYQSIKTNPQITQVIKSVDHDIKTVTIVRRVELKW